MSAKKSSYAKPPKSLLRRKLFWVIVVIIVAMCGTTAALISRHQNQAKNTDNPPTTPRPVTDKTKNTNSTNPPVTPDSSTNSKNGTSTPPSNTPTAPPMSSLPVVKPSGSFVSNHKPGQNGAPLDETSTCNTTAGINCTITFTKDGVTKTLPTKTTDTAGSAYWQWTPQSIGLTTGNWSVTATTTNGQQTESTADPLPLQVP